MKNDPTFKFLAAIILAGVVVAFASPGSSPATAPTAEVEVAAPAAATE